MGGLAPQPDHLGFDMVIADQDASPVTTAAWGLGGMRVDHYVRWLRQERGLQLAGGFGDLAGRIFRIGHMGHAADPDVVDEYLRATEDYVTHHMADDVNQR